MQDLGLVGIRDMGNYDPTVTYQTGHFVYWEGSTYKVLRDNVRGITPSDDGINYGFLARGFLGADAEDITITDTYGEVVTAGGKTLVQRIIDHIISFFVKKEDLSSSGTVNTKNKFAADAWQLNPNNEGSYAKGVASQIDALANTFISDSDYYELITPSPSVPTGEWTKVAERTFDKGIYMIGFYAGWTSNANGSRHICQMIATPSGTPRTVVSNVPINGGTTAMESVRLWEFTEETTLGFWGYQSSGTALNCATTLSWVKLK